MSLRRRTLLSAGVGLPLVAGCWRAPEVRYDGGWVGAQHARGHRLRDLKSGALPTPAVTRRAQVLVVGAGVAGLACARALAQRKVDDVQLLDLEDSAGGNSRGHRIAGMACPLGAHYLPVPGEADVEVVALLEELGLSRIEHGKRVYDERHLCHSPQERLFIGGQWQEGLLPVHDQPEATLAQYRRFAEAVTKAAALGFSLPTAHAPWTAAHQALDAQSFAHWLDQHRFDAAALRTYLDYCCRDDYGAGAAQVSAWAGLHYFASRHGFHAPGDAEADTREGVLTWPQGNGWLTERLAQPHRERLHAGSIALRVDEGRHEVTVDVWNAPAERAERWVARQVVMAAPLFIAQRLLATTPSALPAAVAQMRHAPWLVANLHIDTPLDDAGGAPPAWDNVLHGSPALGYVNAMHQSTRPHPGPTVLTSYWALGGDNPQQLHANRARLLSDGWEAWSRVVLDDLAKAHPDLPAKVKRIDLMRYGHAMSIPVPGLRGSAALQALSRPAGRVHFAHSDLSAYSVFEEAFFHGTRVGKRLAV
ncbi:flavin monoamine oxidase family protein [Piscinibacter gummiphilus]|uniref:FAD-dependent oxidoreductase n=1 Tax=Piscinibacter gummiphilus TaxID=946333 RepID=A0ABZ0CV20_9BURK|nr:NAD(P)-binding protein [Piscinibacter gummiphilus]WOB08821.1 FAD-dependent oxidoreductase [Piscinibacter gummiphilus]